MDAIAEAYGSSSSDDAPWPSGSAPPAASSHHPQHTQQPTPRSGGVHASLRASALSLSGGRCRSCRAAFARPGLAQVDHVVPRGAGGRDHVKNLSAACASCHKNKADETGENARIRALRRLRAEGDPRCWVCLCPCPSEALDGGLCEACASAQAADLRRRLAARGAGAEEGPVCWPVLAPLREHEGAAALVALGGASSSSSSSSSAAGADEASPLAAPPAPSPSFCATPRRFRRWSSVEVAALVVAHARLGAQWPSVQRSSPALRRRTPVDCRYKMRLVLRDWPPSGGSGGGGGGGVR